jgi:hypothetical protein
MNIEDSLRACLVETPAPAGLFGAILTRTAVARRRGALARLAAFLIIVLGSSISLISALRYAGQEFYDSGFYDYLSLILSDRAFVMRSWGEFSYSLIESLPSLALLALAVCSAALVWSAWRALRNAQVVFRFI